MATKKDNSQLQDQIVSQWKAFSQTEAYKDWELSMNQYMQMLQDNVDNLTQPRPVAGGKTELAPMTLEESAVMNQRKVGVRYAMQYPKLRIEA